MRVHVTDDIVDGILTGDGGIEVPEGLATLPLQRLRYVDGKLLDAADVGTFHLDPVRGFLHAVPGEDWVEVACAWSASLVLDGGRYRLRTSADDVADLVAYANARQWARATGGFTVTVKGQAVPFATDEASLAALDRKAMRLAQPNPPASVTWQTGPTTFATIDADDFAHAATLVDDFVQATFDALPAILAALAAGSIRTRAEVDAAAWPAPTAAIA